MEPDPDDDVRHALELQRQRLHAAKEHQATSTRWLPRYVFQRVDNHIAGRLRVAMGGDAE